MSDLREAALASKAWPFEEARRVAKRYAKAPPEKGFVLFETGYGPSGLPHIGTFGEVARTTMIKTAFEVISDIPEPAQIGRQLEAIATRYAEVVPASVRAEHKRRKGRLAVRVFRDPERYYHYAYATRGRRASGATGQFNPGTGQLLIHLTDADRRK